MNERCKWEDYPILFACYKNNSEIVKLLTEYANQKNMTLTLNDKNENGDYPLYEACYHDNSRYCKIINGICQ